MPTSDSESRRPRWVEPPDTRQLDVVARHDRLVLTSIFPTIGHLADAFLAAFGLSTGLILIAFAAATRVGRSPFAATWGPWLLLAGLAPCLWAFLRLRRLAPYRLTLTAAGVVAATPRGMPSTPEEAKAPGAARGGRRELAWGEVERVDLERDGLVVRGGARSILVPWRYRRKVGVRLGVQEMIVDTPCFRFEELDWIGALIERLRSGDVGAIETLVGRRAEPAPTPIWEEPSFVLRGVGATRLRLLALVTAGAAAMLVASRWGLLG